MKQTKYLFSFLLKSHKPKLIWIKINHLHYKNLKYDKKDAWNSFNGRTITYHLKQTTNIRTEEENTVEPKRKTRDNTNSSVRIDLHNEWMREIYRRFVISAKYIYRQNQRTEYISHTWFTYQSFLDSKSISVRWLHEPSIALKSIVQQLTSGYL